MFFSAAQSNAELEKQELAKKHQEDVQALETESDEEINEIQHNSQELDNIDIDKDVNELSKVLL